MPRSPERFESMDAQKAYHRQWYLKHRAEVLERSKERYEAKRDEITAYRREWGQRTDNAHLKAQMVRAARCRSKKLGVPFNLSAGDFEIPQFCPVLGIELRKAKGRHDDQSPALDRRIPELGYVVGNVQVISQRANVLKRDATVDELRALVRFLEKSNNKDESNFKANIYQFAPNAFDPFGINHLGVVKPPLIDSNAEMPTRAKAESRAERLNEEASCMGWCNSPFLSEFNDKSPAEMTGPIN